MAKKSTLAGLVQALRRRDDAESVWAGDTLLRHGLRTVFDPLSAEWDRTSTEEKLRILRAACLVCPLPQMLFDYKRAYGDRPDILVCVEDAMSALMHRMLTGKDV
jgi:hypothetical protein